MKLLHITIQTSKFEEEMNFYMTYAGLKIQTDMRPKGRNMIFLADNAGETNIEIIENADAADIDSKSLSIGFKAEDVDQKRDELAAAGFDVSEMVSPMPGVKFFFVKDPAGVNVQFM